MSGPSGSRTRPSSETRQRFFVFGLLAVLACLGAMNPPEAGAGAWTQPRGTLYNRTAINRYTTGKEFDADGDRQTLPYHGEFSDTDVTDYLEYGVTDRITAVASFVAMTLRGENDIRVNRSKGVGDIGVALRFKLAEGSAGVTSAQVYAKIPSSYEASAALPLGSGEAEYDAHVLYGRSLWPFLPGYCGVEAGYRFRAGDPEDEIRYLVEVGSDIGRSFYLRSKLDGVHGRGAGRGTDVNGNPTIRNSYNLGTLDLTAGRKIGSRFTVEAGYAPGLWGRTTTAGSRFSLAFACLVSPFSPAKRE